MSYVAVPWYLCRILQTFQVVLLLTYDIIIIKYYLNTHYLFFLYTKGVFCIVRDTFMVKFYLVILSVSLCP